MIQAIDLTKRYEDGLLALDHLNLVVREGELFCLLGANGAGKTTTINLILNFLEPTEGRVTLRGVVASYYAKQMAQEALRHIDGVQEIANELQVLSA